MFTLLEGRRSSNISLERPGVRSSHSSRTRKNCLGCCGRGGYRSWTGRERRGAKADHRGRVRYRGDRHDRNRLRCTCTPGGHPSWCRSDLNTYDARTEGWINLIKGSVDQGIASVLFGEPFGGGFGRRQSGTWVTFAPHNWYVSLYLRVGIVGISLFAACILVSAARQLRRRPPAAALALVTTVLVFGWTYSWPWYICILLAWAAAPSTATSSPEVRGSSERRARQFARKALTRVEH